VCFGADLGTDYLDRESLAALIEALKVFEGGVLVITHNRDFSESLCKEYVPGVSCYMYNI
jgi:elongation factor 3